MIVNNNFLSLERISTLLLLSDTTIYYETKISENIILDFLIIDEIIEKFLTRNSCLIAPQNFSKIINTYNRNFDLIFTSNRDLIKKNLFWISTDFDIMTIIDLLYSNKRSDYLLCVLQITSITENSLANLHFQLSSKVPNMLTDLIMSKIIKEILNIDSIINLLMVFIGYPDSLNLRNLSWHGYLWELDHIVLMKYCKFLVVILWNVGNIIANNNYSQIDFDFNKRFKITKLPEFEMNDLFDISLKDLQLSSFSCIHFILEAIDCNIFNKQFYPALCLMLPVFEFYMRMLYIKVNNLSIDLSRAVSHEYFITEDVVISEIIASGNGVDSENKFLQYIGIDFCTLIAEVFMYPMGPRLKDIISHGEVTVVDHDLSSWAILMRYLLFYLINVFEENISDSNFQLIQKWIANVEPRYHTFIIVKNHIISSDNLLTNIKETNDFSHNSNRIFPDYSLFNEKLIILFRDNQIVTECGLTLKLIANQIVHIQEQMKIVIDKIIFLLANQDLNSRHVNAFLEILFDLIEFLSGVNEFCRKLFMVFIVSNQSASKLMKRSLVKMIKRTLMNCDKIRSLAIKHKWANMESIFKKFTEDEAKIDWEIYV